MLRLICDKPSRILAEYVVSIGSTTFLLEFHCYGNCFLLVTYFQKSSSSLAFDRPLLGPFRNKWIELFCWIKYKISAHRCVPNWKARWCKPAPSWWATSRTTAAPTSSATSSPRPPSPRRMSTSFCRRWTVLGKTSLSTKVHPT